MNSKMVKYPALALAAALLISFAVAGNVAAANNEKIKYVDTVHVEGGITIHPEDLAFLLESGIEIPEDILMQLAEIDEITIYVDGLAHVNLMVSEKKGVTDVNLQAFWHGTIAIQADDMPEIVLDFKNAQLSLHVSVDCANEQIDINANFHTNADMTINGESESMILDLDIHVKLLVQDNEVKNLKIGVPEWFELVFA